MRKRFELSCENSIANGNPRQKQWLIYFAHRSRLLLGRNPSSHKMYPNWTADVT